MPDRCTCGAELPADARFCHKCGKPQFEEMRAEVEPAPVITEQRELVPAWPEIGFRNPLAVRIGLFLALLTMLLAVPLNAYVLIWMLVAGALSTWLYRRRTGEPVTVRGGARLGWIIGVFTFLIALILVFVMALALSDKAFVDVFVAQMKQRGTETAAREMVAAFQSPGKILDVVVSLFVFCSLLPVLGGLLGATLFRGPRAAN